MKAKKLLTTAVTFVSMATMFSAFSASATVYDNNGDGHNYVKMASTTISNPDSYFPSGYSTVSAGEKNIYVDGGIIAKMVPQYNRAVISSDNTRESTQAATTGFYFDGSVSCNDRVKYSETKRSVTSTTGWVYCNGNSATYCGYVYYD